MEPQGAQLAQRRVDPPDLVEPGQEDLQRAALLQRAVEVPGTQFVFLRIQVLLAARVQSGVLEQLEARVHPHDEPMVEASTARMANMPGPPSCRLACRMSGVLTNRLGRA